MLNNIRMIMNSGSILGYFLQVVPITCIAGVIYVIFRYLFLKRKSRKIQWSSEIMKVLFVCYTVGLFNLIIMPANFWLRFFDGISYGWWDELFSSFCFGSFNLVPTILKCLNGDIEIGRWIKDMLIGNIVMFMPLGFFIPFVTNRIHSRNIFVFSIVVPLIMEIFQLIFGRSFDIDDLLCNFIGILIGFVVAVIIKAALSPASSMQNNTNTDS